MMYMMINYKLVLWKARNYRTQASIKIAKILANEETQSATVKVFKHLQIETSLVITIKKEKVCGASHWYLSQACYEKYEALIFVAMPTSVDTPKLHDCSLIRQFKIYLHNLTNFSNCKVHGGFLVRHYIIKSYNQDKKSLYVQ